jgi:hypothetical protein
VALSTGNTGATRSNTRRDLPPFWERLSPIDGGYSLSRADGSPLGEVCVYDDREEAGVIICQVKSGRGKWTKVATLKVETAQDFGELANDLAEALSLAGKQLSD